MIKQIIAVVTNASKLPWADITKLTTVVTLVASILGLWWQIDKKLEESIMEQTKIIIQEMDKRTSWIAEYEKEDLFERIQVLELEIEALEAQGETIPERDKFYLRSMKERYTELKDVTWQDR